MKNLYMLRLTRMLTHFTNKGVCVGMIFCVLGSGTAIAEVDLTEFVNVTTESYEDSELGFSLEYPYLWESRPGDLNPVDYHVSRDSYNLPSFSVIVLDAEEVPQTSDDQRENIAHAAKKSFIQRTPLFTAEALERAMEYERNIEIKGLVAVELKVKFKSPHGEQIPLQAVMRAIATSDRLFILVAIDRYDEDALGDQLQGILESFQIDSGDLP